MKKTIKIFGIGAAILLVLLVSAMPVLAVAEEPCPIHPCDCDKPCPPHGDCTDTENSPYIPDWIEELWRIISDSEKYVILGAEG